MAKDFKQITLIFLQMDALINIRRASQSLDLLDGAIRNKGWADLNREQLVEELKK